MTVYCVMEDWCNNAYMPEDYGCYRDKLIAIFNDQHEALNNILMDVDRDEWNITRTTPISVWLDNHKDWFDDKYDVEESLHRYIKPVEIGKLAY